MKIAVCDDDINILRVLGEYFERLGHVRPGFRVDYFRTGGEMIRALPQGNYDLLLLDVELGGPVTGLEIARSARRRLEGTEVIFISNYREYVLDALEAKAYGYLLKPVMYEEFRQVIEGAFSRYARNHQKFTAEFNREIISVDMGDIFYFESYQRRTFVYTARERFRITDRLDVVEQRLPASAFLRIHQGYIVNLSHVKNVNGQDLFLTDGRRLEISFRRKKDVYRRFKRYLMRN